MRRLMWFTIGYAIACAVGTYLLRGNWMLLVTLTGVGLVLCAFKLRKHPAAVIAGTAALGLTVGSLMFFGYDRLILSPATALDGRTAPAELRVTDYSWQTEYGSAVDGTMELNGRSYEVRFYLNEAAELSPGDVIQTGARFRLTDEGGEKEPTFHRTSGILLLGYQRGDLTLTEGEPEWTDFPALWRQRILAMIDGLFPEDAAGFAKALLLGDKTGLTHRQNTDFSVSGISHVVAVSGLHVSILFSLVHLVTGKKRLWMVLLGAPALLVFAAMAGFTASVTRAVIMQLLMLLALAVDREYDPPTALSFACLVMLVQCPLVMASVGFQLSVGSVAGIFLFAGPIRAAILARLPGQGKGKGVHAKLARWFAGSVSVTLSATAVTTPLVAVYFETVSLVGVVTNLLVLFVISGIFYGIMLACAAGFLLPPLGSLVASVVAWPIRYVLGVAHGLAQLPLAAVYTASPYVVIWLVFVYAVIVWTVLTGNRALTALSCGVIGLSIALLASYAEPLLSDYRVTALDVGQGQCLILQSGGNTFLIDCGGDYDEDAGDIAARTLLSQGISRIDGLILTHYDRDHFGGAAYLSERITIDALYLPGEDTGNLTGEIAAAERFLVTEDLLLEFNGAQLQLFAPEDGESDNESCVSVLFQRGKCDTLITGDLSAADERRLIETYDLPDLEVLIVGHHGSKYSTCPELLAATAPDVAIISAGAENSYGHPAPETLERLEAAGCVIYRTDQHGTITYRG